VWALLLIAGGVYLFRSTSGEAPAAPPAPAPPPAPPLAPPPDEAPTWTLPAPERGPKGPTVTPYVLSALLVGGGVAAFLDTAGVVHVSPVPVLAACVLATGLALLVTAWWGRGRGLIPIGILLAIALGLSATADSLHVPLRGGVGDRQWHPTQVGDIRSPYRLRMGTMTVDLSSVPFAGADRTVVATVGVGELVVLVHEGVSVDVTARAGIGAVQLFGHREDGGVGVVRSVSVPAASPDSGHVTLRLRTGIGRVEVSHEVNLREAPRAAA
jgi:hypothetical protein